jgi:hypothetical protein
VAYRSIASVSYATSTTFKPAAPSGLAADDVVVVCLHCAISTSVTVTPPTGGGWTQASDTSNAVSGKLHRTFTYWKRVTASDVTNWTTNSVSQFTLSGSTDREGACLAFSGRETSGDPTDGVNAVADPATAGSGTGTASVTTTANGCDLCFFATQFNGSATTPPTGYTERYDGSNTVEAATNTQATAGGTTAAATVTSKPNIAILIALKPPGAAAGAPVPKSYVFRRPDQPTDPIFAE